MLRRHSELGLIGSPRAAFICGLDAKRDDLVRRQQRLQVFEGREQHDDLAGEHERHAPPLGFGVRQNGPRLCSPEWIQLEIWICPTG